MSLLLWCLAGSAVVVFGGRAAWSYHKWAEAEQKRRDDEWIASWNKRPECPCCGQKAYYRFGKSPCPACGDHTFAHSESASRICAAIIARQVHDDPPGGAR